ncbi:hypothetical protein D1632_00435 [Chryseobacterium nematophagum]|uniref:Uncharacterized protein n=1 Tax=Chryseobacterium nematophagum TaxID=2305228 RepID=A0A3M7LF11_9FLAO|nr:hypothetical protein [Chryseobacterium nematophagum]RMZ61243.1 hypothetical protein D1632_00495 [Chryseobacterium nematophagum]RMZ61313.1 hypothetical protein D1632_00435 [Chryseobacterium nematophagum]
MDKIKTTKERILFYLEKKGFKKETFYKETGMSSSNFKGMALKSDLGIDKLAKIITFYPELKESSNLTWLITGQGNLTLDDGKKTCPDTTNSNEKNNELADLLASLFAQYNTQDKSLLFIQNQLGRIEKKCDEAFAQQKNFLEKILSQAKP